MPEHFPRVALGHIPTPLEPLDNLRRTLGGGPCLYIKRDDCTGLALGGNKTRKLEYLMGEAVAQKAEVVVTQGAVQSNHVRQTAAAAARCGMACAALLERRVPDTDDEYEKNGNVLLDRILNARCEFCPPGANLDEAALAWRDQFAAQGKRAYCIPGGGSCTTGALGYARCAFEIAAQARALGLSPDWIVHPTGSGGTQSGLLAGLAAMDSGIKLLGIAVRPDVGPRQNPVATLAPETLARLDGGKSLAADAVRIDDGFVGPGYGRLSEETAAAIRLLAQTEGILLDPVYSGKGFAGLLAHIRGGKFRDGETVIFLHTGGVPALFAYRGLLSRD